MSEPVSNSQVEDVLASIRRLVTQEDRPARSQGASSGNASDTSVMRGRFVLTPALRVTEFDPSHSGRAEDPGADAVAVKSDGAWQDGSRAEATDPQSECSDAAEMAEQTAPQDMASVLRLDESVRLPDDALGPASGPDATAPADEDRAPAGHSEGQSKNLVRTVGAEDFAFAEDQRGFAVLHARSADQLRGGASASSDPSDRPDDEPGPAIATPMARVERDEAPGMVDTLEMKIAALEAAIARTDDAWEPDGVAADAYSGTKAPAMDWDAPDRSNRKSAPYRLAPEARRDVPSDADGADSVPPAGAAASMAEHLAEHLDEEVLRRIVTEIVHRELQGALGERITRNVRKLVRREILRALASKDFD